MCDISFTRKFLSVVLLAGTLALPQVNVYDDRNQDVSFRTNIPFNRDENFNTNDNFNLNFDRNFNFDNTQRNPDEFEPRFQNPNVNQDPNVNQNPNVNPNPNSNQNSNYNGNIRQLLQALDQQASQQCTNNVAAQWNFETNVNQETQLEAVSRKLYLN